MYTLQFAGLEDPKSRTVVARNLRNNRPEFNLKTEAASNFIHFYPAVRTGAVLAMLVLVLALLACVTMLWRCV